jgi:hypothetical protein
MDWTTANFQPAPCMPCCNAAAATCYLTLPPPIGDPPYVDEATAAAVLADPLQVASCLGYYPGGAPIDSFTASLGSGTLTLSVTDSSPFGLLGIELWAAATCASGATVSFTATGFTTVAADIYAQDGTLVESIDFAASPITSAPLPADGCYLFDIRLSAGLSPVSSGGTTISSSGAITFATVRAAYDDGVGTSYLVCV